MKFMIMRRHHTLPSLPVLMYLEAKDQEEALRKAQKQLNTSDLGAYPI